MYSASQARPAQASDDADVSAPAGGVAIPRTASVEAVDLVAPEVDEGMTHTSLYARPMTVPDHHDPEAEKIIAQARAPIERRCCAHCDYMSPGGWCDAFGEAPPVEFLIKRNECPRWLDRLPF